MRVSRRTVLRGVGASVALPCLEIMSSEKVVADESNGPPLRMAYFYVPNGVNMADWRPAETEKLDEMPATLKPLEPLKDSVALVSNLAAEHCNGNSAAHEPAGGGFLVGKKCKHSEEPEVGGKSVDQVAAQEVGLATDVDSLALGIDPGHRGDHGYSGTYMSHISWRNKTTPAALELNPKQLYERLFRGRKPKKPDWSDQATKKTRGQADTVESSVLDLVQEDTRSLQWKLGYNDRRKLQSYLEGLRNVERRLSRASRDEYSHHQDAFTEDPLLHADEPELPELIIPKGKGIPERYSDHVNLMLDILTLAFQTDTTRVASFMFSYEKSGRAYPEIQASGSHHSTSHHQKKEDKLQQLTLINTLHIELFARMLTRMSQIDEGGCSLLDNVMICYGAGISDGNKHNHDDLPILLAGGGKGAIRGGRHINLKEKVPICNLYLEMLAQMGVQRKGFGDSTGRLSLA